MNKETARANPKIKSSRRKGKEKVQKGQRHLSPISPLTCEHHMSRIVEIFLSDYTVKT
jgi:hypothetical protein